MRQWHIARQYTLWQLGLSGFIIESGAIWVMVQERTRCGGGGTREKTREGRGEEGRTVTEVRFKKEERNKENKASLIEAFTFLGCSETFPNSTFGWVNVKDVANAHVQAFEIPSAKGRYCIAESVVHYSEIVKILYELYPDIQLPEK
ncbi:hypothetical protein RHGRI_038068 [Rhododendron griersonianum]|uniref:Uncharacterized protein n=1 Tax=Rhododendron griersonianum TaxID=479676 RepID=A0AAV6HUS9_9ERIC|nr:hypothetical protein RHGRI_038068 [Rhododendron griersonianum]